MTRCLKCNHVRTAQATNPEWQCPSCGVAYSKAMTPVPASASGRSSAVAVVATAAAPGLLQRLLSTPLLLLLVLGLGGYAYVSHAGKSTAQTNRAWPLFSTLKQDSASLKASSKQNVHHRNAANHDER